MRRPRTGFIVAALVAATAVTGLAKIKTRADFNKAFDFRQSHTWAWNPAGAGQIMAARTADDDKEVVRRLAEPVIFKTVSQEMARKGLTQATGAPDLTLAYYLLITVGSSAQTMGQFLPTTTAWALPPFVQSTQSLEIIQQGSLVLDLSAKGDLVWRGVAEAEIKMDDDLPKREALMREAVVKLLEQYPPKAAKK